MVGLGAGGGRRALRHVEAVHLVAIFQLATAHEVACVAHKAREPRAGKEVCVQRENHSGVFKLIDRIVISAEGQLGTGAHIVAIDRVPAMPLGLREGLLNSLHLPAKRWRTDCASKEAQSRTLFRLQAVLWMVS